MPKYTVKFRETLSPLLLRHNVPVSLANNAEIQLWNEREAYRKALEAAMSLMWMAETYSEGGRVESEDYEAGMAEINETLKQAGLQDA